MSKKAAFWKISITIIMLSPLLLSFPFLFFFNNENREIMKGNLIPEKSNFILKYDSNIIIIKK